MKKPVIRGRFTPILDPNVMWGKGGVPWYINDHCVFRDSDNTLHWFGITNPYPEDGNLYGPGSHHYIGHAMSKQPFGPWEPRPYAMELSPGQRQANIGACFVVEINDRYYMLYNTNVGSPGLHLASSSDLQHWEDERSFEPLSVYGHARDPFVLRYEGKYHLFVTEGKEVSVVAHLTSSDLIRWEMEEPALVSDVRSPYGALESPCLCENDGVYYLFVNFSHRQYEETLVFASDTPYRFDWQDPLCTMFGHACEIFEWGGRRYITHCGIEDRHWDDVNAPYGLYLAELEFI